MKRTVGLVSVVLAVVLCLGLTACGGGKDLLMEEETVGTTLTVQAKDFLKFVMSKEGQAVVATEAADVATDDTAAYDTEKNTIGGKITLIGSTSLTKTAEKLIEKYEDYQPDVEIDLQGGGSSVGISKAGEGLTSTIGMASSALKGDDATALTGIKIATDGIAMVVHKDNTVENLTKAQVTEIYAAAAGTVNWSAYGGADAVISKVGREAGSGTRDAFESIFKLRGASKNEPAAVLNVEKSSTGEAVTAVATDESAIAYVSATSVDASKVRALTIDGKVCSEENIKSGEYAVSRPFLLLVKAGMDTGL